MHLARSRRRRPIRRRIDARSHGGISTIYKQVGRPVSVERTSPRALHLPVPRRGISFIASSAASYEPGAPRPPIRQSFRINHQPAAPGWAMGHGGRAPPYAAAFTPLMCFSCPVLRPVQGAAADRDRLAGRLRAGTWPA
jgi:hypothetical protein